MFTNLYQELTDHIGLVPGALGSAEALSWPCDTELVNSYLKARVFERTAVVLQDEFFPYDGLDPQLLQKLGDLDHCKYLFSLQCRFPDGSSTIGTNFGFPCSIKNVHGTMLSWISPRDMLSFDFERFHRVSVICISNKCMKW